MEPHAGAADLRRERRVLGSCRAAEGRPLGPGTRIPTIIVSPYARKHYVDHTQYDTTSILRFITRRFDLPVLPGLAARDAALTAHGSKPLGDLTNALSLRN